MDDFILLSKQDRIIFKNILNESGYRNDLSWVFRPFNPRSTRSQQSSSLNPLLYRYKVVMDNDVNLLMQNAYPDETLSQRFHRLNDMVREMGCLKSISVVRWLGLVLIKIMKKVLLSVYINEVQLLKVRESMGENPVVLLPTHRSYADFILMTFLCFNYNIDIPVVVAGMDFHAMFGMAWLLRQCGAMYMRRSFKEDKVYSAVFKKYIQTVIIQGDTPFEFFIEGTRSRCGKSLMPKLGLLKMIVEVYLNKKVRDVTFIPVSINYDRLMEDVLFAREMIGIPKPKESTTGLLKGISLLAEQYGSIYINVGQEISLKKFQSSCGTQNFLPVLAETIVRKQQNNTVITYFNMLSAVMICQLLRHECNSTATPVLLDEIMKLKQALIMFGASVHAKDDDDGDAGITRCLKVHKFISQKPNDGLLYLVGTENDCKTSNNVQNTALSLILLQHYSNPCYHFLVNPAMLIIILKAEKHLDRDSLFQRYSFFRILFKHEFLLFESRGRQDFNSTYEVLYKMNLIQQGNDGSVALREVVHNFNSWITLMLPYLRGYLFMCDSLSQLTSKTFERSKLLARIRKQLELELEISNETSLFYSLSSHFLSCCISSLADAKIVFIDGLERDMIYCING